MLYAISTYTYVIHNMCIHMCIHIYIYIYTYMGCGLVRKTRNKIQEGIRNRTGPAEPNRTEPSRLILEPAGIGRGNEPNRTRSNHDVSEKRRPNRVEPGKIFVRTEPNRTEPNQFLFEKSGTEVGILCCLICFNPRSESLESQGFRLRLPLRSEGWEFGGLRIQSDKFDNFLYVICLKKRNISFLSISRINSDNSLKITT